MTAVSARELAALVAEAVNLEGLDPSSLDLHAPLFGDGLGLDSLDMLEISLLVQQRFGVKLKADDPNNVEIFAKGTKLKPGTLIKIPVRPSKAVAKTKGKIVAEIVTHMELNQLI